MLFERIKYYSDTDFRALANESVVISYKELYQRLVYNQKILYANGFQKGDVVLLKLENQMNFVLAFLSLLSIPCWIIPIPVDMAQEEYKKVLYQSSGKVFDDSFYKLIDKYVVTDGELSFPDPDHGGVYHMTSGSTAEPKLCVRTIRSLSLEGKTFQNLYATGKNERILSASPIYHSYALGAALMTAFVSGSVLYVVDSFIPRQLLRIIDTRKINVLLLVPVMAKALCNTKSKINYSMESVRIAMVGSGTVTRELFDSMRNKYGVILYGNYGSTETGGIISRLTPKPVRSIGKPMENVLVKICDDGHNLVKPGETGQLWVRSPYMMTKYLLDDTGTYDKEGYFCTGDLAYEDEEGFLYIAGRIKQLINVGGKKVNPTEVEEIIMKYPGVKECVVIGIKNENEEEYAKALIVGSGIKNKDIYDYCLKSVSRYKCPAIVEFVPKLPRNNMGKIIREYI